MGGHRLSHVLLVKACKESLAANDGVLYADDVALRCDSEPATVTRNIKMLVAAGLRGLPEFTRRVKASRESADGTAKVADPYNIQFWDGDKWRIGSVIRIVVKGKHKGWMVVKFGNKKTEIDPNHLDRRGMPLFKKI